MLLAHGPAVIQFLLNDHADDPDPRSHLRIVK